MAEYPLYNEIYSNPPTPAGANSQQQYPQHHQDPSSSTMGGYPQWETLDPHSLDQSPMVQDLEEMDTPTPTATFDFHPNPSQMLDEPPHIVPSQASPIDNAPILLHHPSEVPVHHHRPSPPAHTQMRSYSGPQHYQTHTPSPLSPGSNVPLPPPTSSSSGKTTGPIRSSTRGGRAAQANPYYRPSPSNLSGLATPFGMGGPGATHSFPSSLASSAAPSPNPGGGTVPMTRTVRKSSQTVRFADTNLAPPVARRDAAPRTRAQSQTSKSVPSSSAQATSQPPRANGSSSSSPQKPTNQSQNIYHSPRQPSSVPSSSSSRNQNQNQSPTQLPPHTARLPLISIPSDITYSAPDCTLVAHLDIPGVRKEALRITLGTCYFNRVRYVCVLGMRGAEGVGTSSSSGGGGSEDLYEILGEKRANPKGKASGDSVVEEEEEETEQQQEPRRQQEPEEEEEEEESVGPNPSRRPSRDIKEELAGFGIPQPQVRRSTPTPTSQPAKPSMKKNLTSRLVNPNVRERKFGVMRRVFQVPGTTELKDIDAALNDGVLTLRIHCGPPFEEDDEVDVPVRIG